MKLSLNWLREFAPLVGDADEIADELSDLGLEVESQEATGVVPDGVVVAQVIEVRPHPDADRIRLVDVDLGDGEALQICCGATNMAAGDRVALATIGTTMPDGMQIAKRKLRGEVSNGMLCSSRELGLGDDHAGILILDGEPTPGAALSDALAVTPDVVIEVDVLPNRPDALSMAGVARDLAARQGVVFTRPDATLTPEAGELDGASVRIDDPALCGRFLAVVLDDVTVGPSPSWLADRLAAAGMRPINNVVDVSNYVMLELGQPNHAFDLATVPGGALGVRRARDGETLVTLDEVDRSLDAADGVIVDRDDRALALAGVMGGASTEISASTTSVLVEFAWWDPDAVGATAAHHNLHSEASLRFKRGVDPQLAPVAAARFAELLADVAGATLRPGVAEALGDLPGATAITLRPARVTAVLGDTFERDRIVDLLEPMGFVCAIDDGSGDDDSGDGDALRVDVPSWRPDCTSEIDLVEEVGRMHGLSRLPRTVPVIAQAGGLSPAQTTRRALRHTLLGAGVCEAMPMPFLAPGDLERCNLPAVGLALANPLAAEESILRTSLLPGLLASVAHNAKHRWPGVWLYEIGNVFELGRGVIAQRDASSAAGRVLDGEREHLAVVLAGETAPAAVRMLDVLVTTAGVSPMIVRNEVIDGLHPGRGAIVEIAGVECGTVGEVHPEVLSRWGIEESVAWLQLDLSVLLSLPAPPRLARPVSRYPSTDVDFAFVVGDAVPAAAVRATVRAAGGDLVQRVELFDVFRSDALGPDRRSLAFSVRFQAPDRTLTDVEVAERRDAIIAEVSATHDAVLRA